MNAKAIEIPKGYEFDKVEGNKIILVRKKEDLNTWEGCMLFLKKGEFIDIDSKIFPFEIGEDQLRSDDDKKCSSGQHGGSNACVVPTPYLQECLVEET